MHAPRRILILSLAILAAGVATAQAPARLESFDATAGDNRLWITLDRAPEVWALPEIVGDGGRELGGQWTSTYSDGGRSRVWWLSFKPGEGECVVVRYGGLELRGTDCAPIPDPEPDPLPVWRRANAQEVSKFASAYRDSSNAVRLENLPCGGWLMVLESGWWEVHKHSPQPDTMAGGLPFDWAPGHNWPQLEAWFDSLGGG